MRAATSTGCAGTPRAARRWGSGSHTTASGTTGQARRRTRRAVHSRAVPPRRTADLKLIALAAPPAKKTSGMTCEIQVTYGIAARALPVVRRPWAYDRTGIVQCWTTTRTIPKTRRTSMKRSRGAGAAGARCGAGGSMVRDTGAAFAVSAAGVVNPRAGVGGFGTPGSEAPGCAGSRSHGPVEHVKRLAAALPGAATRSLLPIMGDPLPPG
nr:hypothetical protein [Microbispora sp. GKU 823]